jgi:nitrous oxidase accessory protein
VLGGGQLGANEWSENGVGNFWSDYAGYDADGDGIGDIPFRSEQLSEQIMSSWPVLQLFRFSVAEAAVDFGSRAVPMFRKEPKFIDSSPLVEPVLPVNAAKPEYTSSQQSARLWAISLLSFAALAMLWGWRGGRFAESSPASASFWQRMSARATAGPEATIEKSERL